MDCYRTLAAAYVRGCAEKNKIKLRYELKSVPLESLTEEQTEEIISVGTGSGLKMYRFKEREALPRVKIALGFLRSVYPEKLLDVGSGRGAFLFPFMDAFPFTEVTSVDILDHRVEFLDIISKGGIRRLSALQEDICVWDAPDNSFDVVTMLEVLEHIPDYEKAVKNAVRLSRRYVAVSVPSKPDNNPEHIHLLTKEKLTVAFEQAGVSKLQFSGVNGHLFMIAKKE